MDVGLRQTQPDNDQPQKIKYAAQNTVITSVVKKNVTDEHCI